VTIPQDRSDRVRAFYSFRFSRGVRFLLGLEFNSIERWGATELECGSYYRRPDKKLR
jgi:hypothetical protein